MAEHPATVPDEVLERRYRAQLLAGDPAPDAITATQRLLAVQAQEPRGARLALRARTSGVLAADVDRMLDAGEAVVSWLNRGTLHLVAREDFRWLHPLTTPQLATGNRRRLEQEGVSPARTERGVEVVRETLADRGPSSRAELQEALAAAGVPTARQALVHVIFAATIAGHVVRGPLRGSEQAFVLAADWLGADADTSGFDEDRALAELARRYLAGHGPASDRDLARWAGITLGRARRGLEAIATELSGPDGDGLLALAAAQPAAGMPPPRMLGPFEPVLLGWVSRREILGEAGSALVTVNGIFKRFAMVGGHAVGTWRMPQGAIELDLYEEIDAADRAALDRDSEDVLRFLGG